MASPPSVVSQPDCAAEAAAGAAAAAGDAGDTCAVVMTRLPASATMQLSHCMRLKRPPPRLSRTGVSSAVACMR